MKKLGKLKLNVLSDNNLTDKEMNELKGGRDCTCSCNGPSSSSDNKSANYNLGSNGGYSTSGCNSYTYSDNGGSITCYNCNETISMH